MIESFPVEIEHNILFRLPIKSLIICTSVSKSWKSFIKNSSFIRAHLRNRINTSHQRVNRFLLHGVRHETPSHTLDGEDSEEEDFYSWHEEDFYSWHEEEDDSEVRGEVYCLHDDNDTFEEYCKIDFQLGRMVRLANQMFAVAGTCNGLVFLGDDFMCKAFNYIIWNPLLRKAVMLPLPTFTFTTHGPFEDCIGFGFDAITNDYKVVRLVILENLRDKDENPTVAEVYSLAMDSWRSLGSVPPCEFYGRKAHPLCNGTIHWVVRRLEHVEAYDYFILTFDLASESFGEILMPNNAILQYEPRVSVSGDGKSLALFVRYDDENDDIVNLDIWLMTEYSIHESWTKLITLRPPGPNERLTALCFRKSGELLLLPRDGLSRGKKLASFDIQRKQLINIGNFEYVQCSLFPYEESLVLLDMDDAFSC